MEVLLHDSAVRILGTWLKI